MALVRHAAPSRASLPGLADEPVMLRLAMERQIEDVVLDLRAPIEVAIRNDDLVTERRAHRHDLSGRRDDAALADKVTAFLSSRLRDPHHPGAVLVGAGLHGEVVVEVLEVVKLGSARIVDRGVVAEQHDLHPRLPGSKYAFSRCWNGQSGSWFA